MNEYDALENLTEEDFAAIGRILEGSENRRHGEDLLAALDAGQRRRQGLEEDPLLKILRQAHQAKVEEADKQ